MYNKPIVLSLIVSLIVSQPDTVLLVNLNVEICQVRLSGTMQVHWT